MPHHHPPRRRRRGPSAVVATLALTAGLLSAASPPASADAGSGRYLDARTTPTPRIVNLVKPRVRGKARVGAQLKASKGRWNVGDLDYAFRWYGNGRALPRGDRRRYRLTPADRRKRISVRVTVSRPGFSPMSVVSESTRAVR